ncbi:hypothetical protein RJT34_06721 [Clitoria ternatea]|uniref:Uncharacterized protein n=1 Tax=Clitoria ternatea TaxID=43366 RepID=A0AAN9K4F3_CLITE
MLLVLHQSLFSTVSDEMRSQYFYFLSCWVFYNKNYQLNSPYCFFHSKMSSLRILGWWIEVFVVVMGGLKYFAHILSSMTDLLTDADFIFAWKLR